MTITTAAVKVTYATDGVSRAFPINFPFFGSAELNAALISPDGNTVSFQVLNGNYTVSGGAGASGTLTFLTAPSAGQKLLIYRLTNRTQLIDLQANDNMPADQLETAYDRGAAIAAEDLEMLGRTLMAPVQEGPLGPLPSASQRAGSLLAFNALSNPVAFPPPSIARANTLVSYDAAGNLALQPLTIFPPGLPGVTYVQLTPGVDMTAAVRAAFASGRPVQLPDGDMMISDMLTLSTSGQQIVGYGRTRSRFIVTPTFNLAAQAIILETMTGLIDPTGAEKRDFGIVFAQPDTAVFAQLIAYPPALLVQNAPRMVMSGIRFTAGYRGLVFDGNCGGAFIDRLETSCLMTNLEMADQYDSMRFSRWHCWPFGLSVNQQQIFYSTNCYGGKLGRVDDFHFSDCLWLCGSDTAMLFYDSPDGGSLGTFTDCDFDTCGGLNVTGNLSFVTMIGGSLTLGIVGGGSAVKNQNSRLTLNGVFILSAVPNKDASDVTLDGGFVTVTGCRLETNVDQQQITCLAGEHEITGNQFISRLTTTSTAASSIALTAGTGVISGNSFNPKMIGPGVGGIAIGFAGDASYAVVGNEMGGRSIAYTAPLTQATFAANRNLQPDFVSNFLAGQEIKTRFILSADGSGNVTVPHGIQDAQKRLISIQAFFKASAGNAAPMTVIGVDGTNIICSGGTNAANARCRILLSYTNTTDNW